jgi:hypothetical protein
VARISLTAPTTRSRGTPMGGSARADSTRWRFDGARCTRSSSEAIAFGCERACTSSSTIHSGPPSDATSRSSPSTKPGSTSSAGASSSCRCDPAGNAPVARRAPRSPDHSRPGSLSCRSRLSQAIASPGDCVTHPVSSDVLPKPAGAHTKVTDAGSRRRTSTRRSRRRSSGEAAGGWNRWANATPVGICSIPTAKAPLLNLEALFARATPTARVAGRGDQDGRQHRWGPAPGRSRTRRQSTRAG